MQRVLAAGELAVDFYQVNSQDGSNDDVKAELNETLRAKGFDLAAGISLRVGVATRNGWPCVVVIIYSHVLLDFGSAALLGREFSQLVADSVG